MIKGTLIKESITDENILDMVDIDSVEIWRADNHTKHQPKYWTAIFFSTSSSDFPQQLSYVLGKHWYVDMRDGDEVILVFCNKVMRYVKGDTKGKQRTQEYCKQLGIPDSQIDW